MKRILNYPVWVFRMFPAVILTDSASYFTGGGLVTKSCLTLTTPWTVSHQAPLTMGFSRQEYWSGFPSPGDRPDPVTEPGSAALQVGFFFTNWDTTEFPYFTGWLIIFCSFFFFFFFTFSTTSHSVWDLSSVNRDQICSPWSESMVSWLLNHEESPQGNSSDITCTPQKVNIWFGKHPLLYACLKILWTRGVWCTTFFGITKSLTQLSN